MSANTSLAPPRFLSGGGKMGELLRAMEWSASPLGQPETWPQSLRVVVGLMLHSRTPMLLWWGPSLVQLHNEAYHQMLGIERQSSVLGKPARGRTDDLWAMVEPLLASVMDGGEGLSGKDTMLPMPRNGQIVPVYWDFELCPIEDGETVGGVLAIVRDVSDEHLDDDRLGIASANLVNLFDQSPGFIALLSGPDHVYEFTNVEYRKLMGERDFVGKPVRVAVPEIDGQGFYELLDGVYRSGQTYVGKSLPMRFRPVPGEDLIDVLVDLVYKPITDPAGNIFGIFVEGTYTRGDEAKVSAEPVRSILTDRERQVLGWAALGKTAAETAMILGISKRTTDSYIYSAARKLDTVNGTQTVVEAIRRGELKL